MRRSTVESSDHAASTATITASGAVWKRSVRTSR